MDALTLTTRGQHRNGKASSLDAAEFYFMLAITESGHPPKKSEHIVATFLRRGLLETAGARYRLTESGQRLMMDGWTEAILDALGTYESGLDRDSEPSSDD